MDDEDNNTSSVVLTASGSSAPATSASKSCAWASNFTDIEDLLCVQAYYRVLEDSINGTKQKATVFCKKIEDYYKQLVLNQLEYDKKVIVSDPVLSDDKKKVELEKLQSKYPMRTRTSLQQRASKKIIPATIKFMSILKAVSIQVPQFILLPET